MRKVSVTLGHILLFLISMISIRAQAQNQSKTSEKPGAFSLKNGDRVVFLGNSLFENDFQYGYLELALTTRFADHDVTFRNLGWTGDNVWGAARSTFTNPPTPYQHLINNIITAKPTVVFLAYGSDESQEGEAGLQHFREGLNKLLDKIDSLGARTILLSPIPAMSSDSSINLTSRNADIMLYASAVEKVASERGKQFIDIYKPIQEVSKKTTIIENGIQLNETGYYYLAGILERGLGLTSKSKSIEIAGKDNVMPKFNRTENYLSLPVPESVTAPAQTVKISGLKKGFYTLTANKMEVATASAKKWSEGVEIKQGPSFIQVNEMQEMILKKNELHFFQYRPINETYIIGFRAYEQGKHVKDLEDQNILIKWLESQIALLRVPKEVVYELSAVK